MSFNTNYNVPTGRLNPEPFGCIEGDVRIGSLSFGDAPYIQPSLERTDYVLKIENQTIAGLYKYSETPRSEWVRFLTERAKASAALRRQANPLCRALFSALQTIRASARPTRGAGLLHNPANSPYAQGSGGIAFGQVRKRLVKYWRPRVNKYWKLKLVAAYFDLRIKVQRIPRSLSKIRARIEKKLLNASPDRMISVIGGAVASLVKAGHSQAAAEMHNRMMHMLNGNIAQFFNDDVPLTQTGDMNVFGSVKTSSDPLLGGAVTVLTEYLFGDAPHSDARVGPETFYRTTTDQPLLMGSDTAGCISRPNAFTVHYPEGSNRLDTRREDNLVSRVMSHSHVRNNYVGKYVDVAPDQRHPGLGGPSRLEAASDVTGFWADHQDPDQLKRAEIALSSHRATGMRGQKLILGWEATSPTRQIELRRIALADAEGSCYKRFFYRLWMRYFLAALSECNDATGADAPSVLTQLRPLTAADIDYDPQGLNGANRIQLESVSAVAPLVAGPGGPVDPEAILKSDQHGAADTWDEIQRGATHLIDVEGMTDEMIRETLLAFAANEVRYASSAWGFARRGAAADEPGYYTSAALLPDRLDDCPTRFILHYGSRPGLNARVLENTLLGRGFPAIPADPAAGIPAGPAIPGNPARSPWNVRPNRQLIASVIRFMIGTTGAVKDCWDALDLALHTQNFSIPSLDLVGLRDGVRGLNRWTSCGGTQELSLPRDYTPTAYFDCARTRVPMSYAPDISALLALSPRRLFHTATLTAHAHAASLNWASFALSLRGYEWHAFTNRAGVTQYTQAHLDSMVAQLRRSDVTVWHALHRIATAHMYGFAPALSTSLALGRTVAPIWQDRLAPYIANPYYEMWMLQMLPIHMKLPSKGTAMDWPDDAQKPLRSAYETDMPSLRVARALPAFHRRTFLQDGKMMYNLQHAASVPGQTTHFRNDLVNPDTPAFELLSWEYPTQYQLPAAPAGFQPTWLAPAGSLFGAWLLPGSVQNYSSSRARIRANGIRATAPSTVLRDAWARQVLDAKQTSVGISYIPPPGFKIDTSGDAELFNVIWFKNNSYAGMTLEQVEPGQPLIGSSLPLPEGPHSLLPTHLANDNYPDMPKGGKRVWAGRSQPSPADVADEPADNFPLRSALGDPFSRPRTVEEDVLYYKAAASAPQSSARPHRPVPGVDGDSTLRGPRKLSDPEFQPHTGSRYDAHPGPQYAQKNPLNLREVKARVSGAAPRGSRPPRAAADALTAPPARREIDRINAEWSNLRAKYDIDAARDLPTEHPARNRMVYLEHRFKNLTEMATPGTPKPQLLEKAVGENAARPTAAGEFVANPQRRDVTPIVRESNDGKVTVPKQESWLKGDFVQKKSVNFADLPGLPEDSSVEQHNPLTLDDHGTIVEMSGALSDPGEPPAGSVWGGENPALKG
ncbi:putative structural protein [Rosellinia necatrix fusagravirus 3]|uniref:Putative structural protein n=1 Tax=Rosellinia necatrix fusagravirus 3 TaxID=2056544 RepID=A0A2Z5WAD8_9VIRU|nr:putative structural protein [Rosellinia necatrix fusagravirus 3]